MNEDKTLPDQRAAADESIAIWSRLRGRIEVLLHTIEAPVSALLDRSLTADEVEVVVDLTNRLARWFGHLGLTVAAELIRDTAEAVTAAEADISAAVAAAGLLEDLRVVLADTHATLSAEREHLHHVVAAGEASADLDSLLFILSTSDIGVSHLDETNPPHDIDAVVLPIASTGLTATSTLVRATRQLYPDIPIVAIVPDGHSLPASVRGGLAAVVSASAPADAANQVIEAMARAELARSALFASEQSVDATSMAGKGFNCSWCDVSGGPEPVVEQLRLNKARCLVVVDTELNVMRNIARLVRTDPELRATPLIAVPGTDPRPHEQIALLRSGFDTVAPAEVTQDLLATLILTRLRTRTILEPLEAVVHANSALPLTSLRLLGERLLVTEARMDRRVSVALLQLDPATPPEVLRQAIGPLAGEFRRADLTGWYGERQAVVMLPGLPRHAAVKRFAGVVEKLGLGNGSARIGISEFPADGRTLTPLIDAAASAIERTSENDGPLISTTDWRPNAVDSADVLIVDPDPALRAVISAVLTERGFSSTECSNGTQALAYLTGPNRPQAPLAILVEFELEGIDGIHLLRHLRDAGVLGRFKTIMLASRTAEAELHECFELGAADVIRKPFAPLILGHRVSRIIEAT